MLKTFGILVLLGAVAGGRAEPIRTHPDNPHYYLFRGRPTVLITSAEHYGAVINRAFDYNAYLDALKSYGLNYTRIYPAAFIEPEGTFLSENTLAPKSDDLIQPWARSSGGNRFDLDRWDPEYFRRLKDFIAQADARGIVVEVCFFNAQNKGSWPMSPLYWKNNIQGEGRSDYDGVQTLKHPDLVRRQNEFVRRIVEEVNAFDNVILEICDEPTVYGTTRTLAGPWIGHLVEVVKQTEIGLPKKHLLGQQMMGAIGGPLDFTSNPDVSVIVAQYVWQTPDEQVGGMKVLDSLYDRNKPTDLNEKGYYPLSSWYRGDKAGDVRVEAWEFMVGRRLKFQQSERYVLSSGPGRKGSRERASASGHAEPEAIHRGIRFSENAAGSQLGGERYARRRLLPWHQRARGTVRALPSPQQAQTIRLQSSAWVLRRALDPRPARRHLPGRLGQSLYRRGSRYRDVHPRGWAAFSLYTQAHRRPSPTYQAATTLATE
jgi:hypothetical protein